MQANDMSIAKSGDALDRIAQSDLARAFSATPMGTRARGPKPGSNTQDAFKKLTEIASKADQPLNEAVGGGLQAGGYIMSFATEKDLGSGLSRYTDLLCQSASLGVVRLEVMWRAKAGRADIANYTLTKLYNYGRAIGLLE